MKHLLVGISICLLAIPAYADIVVRIVDIPTQVPQYSPVFVTASIENTGKDSVLVPANEFSGSNFEIGHSPDQLSTFLPFLATGGGRSVWLHPGDVFYYRQDLNREMQNTGRYFIRALLRSTGECQYRPSSPDDLPVVLLNDDPAVHIVQCWAGSVRSEIKEVEVVEPNGPTDGAALEYIKSEEYPVKCCINGRFQNRIIFGYGRLLNRFPTSHYTFVGAMFNAHSLPRELEKILKLQPEHPMAVYMRLGLALALIENNREAEVTPEFIATLKLKPAHEAYLGQVLREKRLREMMKSKTPGPGK